MAALANGTTSEARAEAKQHYEAGEVAFRLGDFDLAIKEWRACFQLSSEPLLLYNLGQAYRQKGDKKQALFFYQQFLSTGAGGEARETTLKRVHELQQAIESERSAQAAPPRGPEAPAPPRAQPVAAATREMVEVTTRPRARSKTLGLGLTIGGVAIAVV